MVWYYARGDERVGPVSAEDLKALVDRGEVTASTLVWNQSMTDWAPLSSVELIAGEASNDVSCAECGRTFDISQTVDYDGRRICAECKPRFVQRVREGAVQAGAGMMVYGGFWIRFVARIIDGLILTPVNLLLQFLLLGSLSPMATMENPDEISPLAAGGGCLLVLLQLGVAIAYETWFVGAKAATPGKMALGLKVVRPDGGAVSYGRAFGRYWGNLLSSLTLTIGYIIAAFDDQKRALHDHICGTRVIRS